MITMPIENLDHQREIAEKLASRNIYLYTKIKHEPCLTTIFFSCLLFITCSCMYCGWNHNLDHDLTIFKTELARLKGNYQSYKGYVDYVNFSFDSHMDLTIITNQDEVKVFKHVDDLQNSIKLPIRSRIKKGDYAIIRLDQKNPEHSYAYRDFFSEYILGEHYIESIVMYFILLIFVLAPLYLVLREIYLYLKLKRLDKRGDFFYVNISDKTDMKVRTVEKGSGMFRKEMQEIFYTPYFKLELPNRPTIYFKGKELSTQEYLYFDTTARNQDHLTIVVKIYMYNIDNPKDQRYFFIENFNYKKH